MHVRLAEAFDDVEPVLLGAALEVLSDALVHHHVVDQFAQLLLGHDVALADVVAEAELSVDDVVDEVDQFWEDALELGS